MEPARVTGGARSQQLRHVGRRSLVHETVQEEIKRYILENNLRPGDPLPPEGELASQLGVGRNSVREAVKSLEALGILTVRAGAGLAVRGFTVEPFLDGMTHAMLVDLRLFAEAREARQFLEKGIAPRIIERATPEQLAHLDAILLEWKGVAARGKYSSAHDRRFHEAVWETIDNRFLSGILEAFWDAQLRVFDRVGDVIPTEPLIHHAVHVAIRDAIASDDEAALRDALDQHYVSSQTRQLAATATARHGDKIR